MINLLQETREALKDRFLQESDVLWVGTVEHNMPWSMFALIANVNYENGFGSQNVCADLLIVGKDWWFERDEYDGSENWTFNTMPLARSAEASNISTVFANDDYDTLIHEVNNLEL